MRTLALLISVLCYTTPVLLGQDVWFLQAGNMSQRQGNSGSVLNRSVTLSQKSVSLRLLLQKFTQITGARFLFDDSVVKNFASVSAECDGTSLADILRTVLTPLDLAFVVSPSGQIMIVNKIRIESEMGALSGEVRSKSGEALIGANIVVRETRQGASANQEGYFCLKALHPGKYTCDITFVGCEKCTKQVTITAGSVLPIECILDPVDVKIGEMVVVGMRELMPTVPETKTEITSAEIEHHQASNVGDVLDLVPGVQKSGNPGLGKTSQIAIRGAETSSSNSSALTAFGTKILIDGVPVSNNANLQFERWSDATSGISNMGRGVDLRLIPADNIDVVEVVRGIPSVRYGELTSGLVNIKTKIGPQPHRLKIKNNPNTREGNLGGGFLVGETGWSYNLNAAQSDRDIRKTGDEYSRLTAQVAMTAKTLDNQLLLTSKLLGQKIFDEEQPAGDVYQTKNYNRGYSISYSVTGEYSHDQTGGVDFNAYVNFNRQNSMRSRLVQSELRILPSGDTISAYVGKVETHGREWTTGGRLEMSKVTMTGDFIHSILFGADVQYDANTGEGVLFDTLYSYYGISSGSLPYTFDAIPGKLIASLYAEDKITGHLGLDFSLVLGARYEMYTPRHFNLKGLIGDGNIVESDQGTYFNPRGTLMVYFDGSSQMRVTGGILSKAPPLSTMYRPPEVFRWKNPYDNSVTYFRTDHSNPAMKAFRERQLEVSFDEKLFDMVGMTVSGYAKSRFDEPTWVDRPLFTTVNANGRPLAMYIGIATEYANVGWTKSNGTELSLRTKKIRPLNMDFQVAGSYNFTRDGDHGLAYDNLPDASKGRVANYVVPGTSVDTLVGYLYPSSGRWQENILLNYFIRYTAPSLGVWVTLRAENLLWLRSQNVDLEPLTMSMLTETGRLNRVFDESIKTQTAKWLFNLNISKSLFKGAELSFYVNNFLDDPGIYRYQRSADPTDIAESSRNPDLFYGIEFSMSLDAILK